MAFSEAAPPEELDWGRQLQPRSGSPSTPSWPCTRGTSRPARSAARASTPARPAAAPAPPTWSNRPSTPSGGGVGAPRNARLVLSPYGVKLGNMLRGQAAPSRRPGSRDNPRMRKVPRGLNDALLALRRADGDLDRELVLCSEREERWWTRSRRPLKVRSRPARRACPGRRCRRRSRAGRARSR